jgi:hypothetical protein
LEPVALSEGSNYTLECIISGEPEPRTVWLKDDVEIEKLPPKQKSGYMTTRYMNVYQLNITNADADLHNGIYTCQAKNDYGEAKSSCQVTVKSNK